MEHTGAREAAQELADVLTRIETSGHRVEFCGDIIMVNDVIVINDPNVWNRWVVDSE